MAGAAYAITPHPIAGFSRGTPAPSYTPSYAWPPTPLGTPPTVAGPYGTGAAYLPPVSATNGSPYAQPPHAHPHALPPPPPPNLPAPYDRTSHPETALAPPATAPPGMPVFPGRSPRTMHEQPVQRSPPNYGQHPQPPLAASPRPSGVPMAHINGAARSPHLLKQGPPASLQPLNPIGTPPKLPESSSSGTVPSIGALMSGASLAPLSSATATPGDPGSSPNGNGGSSRGEGPRDIPHEKIGFGGEDTRALRQLDRVFI
jgi:hypothetical protein